MFERMTRTCKEWECLSRLAHTKASSWCRSMRHVIVAAIHRHRVSQRFLPPTNPLLAVPSYLLGLRRDIGTRLPSNVRFWTLDSVVRSSNSSLAINGHVVSEGRSHPSAKPAFSNLPSLFRQLFVIVTFVAILGLSAATVRELVWARLSESRHRCHNRPFSYCIDYRRSERVGPFTRICRGDRTQEIIFLIMKS